MRQMRRLAVPASAGLLVLAACTFSHDIEVQSHVLLRSPEGGQVNPFNLEEQLQLGYVPEVLDFFRRGGQRSIEQTRAARAFGQALLEAGDFGGARVHLERAYAQEARVEKRAETAWLVSQTAYWQDDYALAAHWARTARGEGHRLPQGWITFLESAGAKSIYSGVEPGTRVRARMLYGRPEIIRTSVRVNGGASDEVVFDTGASLSLLTEEAAKRFGVEIVPDATAGAYGLHRSELTMRFGWAKTVEFGGIVLKDVPFGILPDDTLTFETPNAGAFRFDGVLGTHLLKDFDWRLEYRERRIAGVKLDSRVPRGGKGQNVFFRRLKPMVRSSFNQEGWFLFLLDTGSEPTMITRLALRRSRTRELEGSYPMTIEGIGKSRVTWSKLSDAKIGLDRYQVRFKDIVVKEEAEGIEDGVVGSSFLSNFDVELRFSAMSLRLERPLDRIIREDVEPAAGLPASR